MCPDSSSKQRACRYKGRGCRVERSRRRIRDHEKFFCLFHPEPELRDYDRMQMLKNRDASAGDQPRGKATYGAKAKTATQDKENCMQAPSLMDDHRAQTPLEALEEVKLSANSGGNREIGQAANATKTQIKSANKRPIIDTIQAQADLIETLQARMEAMEEQVRACKESTDRSGAAWMRCPRRSTSTASSRSRSSQPASRSSRASRSKSARSAAASSRSSRQRSKWTSFNSISRPTTTYCPSRPRTKLSQT